MSYGSRKEALLNEYKGNLFEFLVSKEISHLFSFEVQFLSQFDQKAFETLTQQEDFIRNFFPEYLEFLPMSAKYCAQKLINVLDVNSCQGVEVVGKMQASKSNQETYSEVDLILKCKSDINCSLKLSRQSSFVNTKSAGIKSFFEKYFQYKDISNIQAGFTFDWNLEYEIFARNLHKAIDLEYTQLFENWQQNRSEVLPGELNQDLKLILYDFYEKMNEKLSKILQELYHRDKDQFKKSLMPLIGFSKSNIVQVCLFYTKKQQSLTCKEIQVHAWDDVLKALDSELIFKVNKTNIEICSMGLTIQIRMKPMNTFIQKGYKVNCSVKFN